MVHFDCPVEKGQRTPVETDRLVEAALLAHNGAEVVDCHGQRGRVAADAGLLDLDRAPVQRLCFAQVATSLHKRGEVVQCDGDFGMIATERRFEIAEQRTELCLRLGVTTEPSQDRRMGALVEEGLGGTLPEGARPDPDRPTREWLRDGKVTPGMGKTSDVMVQSRQIGGIHIAEGFEDRAGPTDRRPPRRRNARRTSTSSRGRSASSATSKLVPPNPRAACRIARAKVSARLMELASGSLNGAARAEGSRDGLIAIGPVGETSGQFQGANGEALGLVEIASFCRFRRGGRQVILTQPADFGDRARGSVSDC